MGPAFSWPSDIPSPAEIRRCPCPRYSGDGEAQQARCFCVGVRERNYYMATGPKGLVLNAKLPDGRVL